MNESSQAIDQDKHSEDEKGFGILVLYNGKHERIEVRPEETMGTLRDSAVKAFGNLPNPHTLSLFSKAGVEFLDDQQTVRAAGIHRNDELLLRPSAVRGG